MELDGLAFNLITLEKYLQELKMAGFSDISFQDTTEDSIKFTKKDVELCISFEQEIKEVYDTTAYDESLASWQSQQKAFEERELMTAILRAMKAGE